MKMFFFCCRFGYAGDIDFIIMNTHWYPIFIDTEKTLFSIRLQYVPIFYFGASLVNRFPSFMKVTNVWTIDGQRSSN